MDVIRGIVAVLIFCSSSYLVYDLLAVGFSWPVLLVCIGGFILAHYIWPKNIDSDNEWCDVVGFIVDLPYRSLALAIRSVGKVLKSDGDTGIDP